MKLQVSVVDSNALTFAKGHKTRFSTHVNGRTHQQTPIVTHKGFQYTTYFNGNRHLCVARRELPSNDWKIIEFEDHVFKSSDSHNTAVIGICEGDGTIHLAFDHHADVLKYRVSELGIANNPKDVEWSATLFGPVADRLGSLARIDRFTYPRFFNAPNGNLMLSYRYFTSGNGDSMIHEYNAETHDWTPGMGRFIARDIGEYERDGEISAYRCAYMNNLTYAGKRLHASWVWRDRFKKTSFTNQHDVCYAYSDDDGRTWKNSKGSTIGETGTDRVIHLDSSGLVVVPVETGYNLSNQNGHYAYPDGSLHMVVLQSKKKGERSSFHHHWRDRKGKWKTQPLKFSGGRAKILGDRDGSLFLFYEHKDEFRIAKGTPNSKATKWKWRQVLTEDHGEIGSEAVVDFTRWEKERVISAYMQELPGELLSYGDGEMIDGKPTPLWVIDYQVSAYAANPQPSADAEQIPVNARLKWVPGIGSKAHHLYVGTSAAQVAKAKKTSREFIGQLDEPEFSFTKALRPASTFYWRVDEVMENNTVRRGQVWKFITEDSPPEKDSLNRE
ncbi:BNR repeat-containing protein [Pontiellaceae bacterium B12227]|nr:BNR repeat-containing protein [Pontiellaceae bacterium B12227]